MEFAFSFLPVSDTYSCVFFFFFLISLKLIKYTSCSVFHLGASLTGICLYILGMGERTNALGREKIKAIVTHCNKEDGVVSDSRRELEKKISAHTETYTHVCVCPKWTFICIIRVNPLKDPRRRILFLPPVFTLGNRLAQMTDLRSHS